MYSQHNEEELINKYLCPILPFGKGKYIDIGAADASINSNTYFLYRKGWRGLLVEPCPIHIRSLRRNRPNDELFEGAISDKDGITTMSDMVMSGTQFFQEYSAKYPEYQVRTKTLNSLLKEYPNFWEPDLLNLDVEGAERQVLKGVDWNKFKPTLIIVEYKLREIDQRPNWEGYLLPNYQLITFVGSNAIYMRKEKFQQYCEKQGWLIPQYEPLITQSERDAINQYMLDPGFLTEYKNTTEFENQIAKYLGVKHAIVVNNGTISLSLALLAMGIGPGDRVLVPNVSMIATPNAVRFIGAEPVFIDVDKNLLLNSNDAIFAIKSDPTIKAIIFVSLDGRWYSASDWPLIEVCRNELRNFNGEIKPIALIEDAAQAFGSRNYELHQIGSRWFNIFSFSFSMPKIITTGQGGCLTTDDDVLADKIRKLKDFGRDGGGNDIHNYFGINSKFTEFQAVIGISQLQTIEWRTKRKKAIYQLYRDLLKNVSQVEMIPTNLDYTVPWFVDIFVPQPYKLVEHLKSKGIGTRKFYPPINKQLIYNDAKTFVTSEYYCNRGLWLPSALTITDEQIAYICKTIKDFYDCRS